MNEHPTIAILHRVRDDIPVGAPPIEQVVAAAESRRRARRVGLAAAAAVALIASAGAVVALQREDAKPPEPAIRHLENPAPVAWWGDGWLHVAHAAVEAPRPDLIVPVGDGVVTWQAAEDGPSPLIHVTDEGRQTTIGTRTSSGDSLTWGVPSRLASDPDAGWVAWVDHASGEPPVLVVHDTGADEEVARLELADTGPRQDVLYEGPHPIAIEDGVVYYAGFDADYRWEVTDGQEPDRVTDSTTYLAGREAGVEMTRPFDPPGGYGKPVLRRNGGPGVEFPYDLGLLSPDGRYGAGLTAIGPQARMYDLRSREQLPTGMGQQSIDDLAFGPDGTVTYALSTAVRARDVDPEGTDRSPDFSVAPYKLVTCEIATATCETVVDGIEGEDDVVLSD